MRTSRISSDYVRFSNIRQNRAGKLFAEREKNKGTRGNIQEQTGGTKLVPPDETPKLEEIGVTKKQSSQWQKIAKIPEENSIFIIWIVCDKLIVTPYFTQRIAKPHILCD